MMNALPLEDSFMKQVSYLLWMMECLSIHLDVPLSMVHVDAHDAHGRTSDTIENKYRRA